MSQTDCGEVICRGIAHCDDRRGGSDFGLGSDAESRAVCHEIMATDFIVETRAAAEAVEEDGEADNEEEDDGCESRC